MQWEHRGAVLVALCASVACGGAERRAPADDGGTASGGLAAGSGGAPSAGARTGSGGRGAGGVPAPGGAPSTGGLPSAGGAPSAGGNPGTCQTESECPRGRICSGSSISFECIPGECSTDANCSAGEQCHRGVCEPLGGPGQACGWERRCRSGLACRFGACTPPLEPGARCDFTCEAGRFCMTDAEGIPFCIEAETFCPNGQEPDAGGSQTCTYTDYCDESAVDGGVFRCRPRRGLAEPCTYPVECGVGLTCSNGTCARKSAGARCLNDADCPEDTYCFTSVGTTGMICFERLKPGERCAPLSGASSTNPCVQGYLCGADSSRCEPLEAFGCLGGCPKGDRCEKKVLDGKCVRFTN